MDLNEGVRQNIAQLMKELAPAARGARWVQTDGMHVTLKFIGETVPEMVERVKTALGDLRSAKPIEMSFRGVGCFPNERRPRVLWAGIEASQKQCANCAPGNLGRCVPASSICTKAN